jgi:hypothetical protein
LTDFTGKKYRPVLLEIVCGIGSLIVIRLVLRFIVKESRLIIFSQNFFLRSIMSNSKGFPYLVLKFPPITGHHAVKDLARRQAKLSRH